MSTAPIAMQAAGAGFNATSAYFGAASQKSALQSQGRMADINAGIAELGAQNEILRGQREEQSVRLRGASLKGAQRASMAANGVDMTSGTAQQILTSSDYFTESDANTVAANAVKSAFGYRSQAVGLQNQARSARASASTISPVMAAVTSLIGSSGQLSSSWYQQQKAGVAQQPRSFGPRLDSFFGGTGGSGD